MAGGKTIIGGTVYDVSGGKARVGDTNYSIVRGKTMVGGTVYEIAFDNIPSTYKRVKFIVGPGGSYINFPSAANTRDGLKVEFTCQGSDTARYSAALGFYSSTNTRKQYFTIYDASNSRSYTAYFGSTNAQYTAAADFHTTTTHEITITYGDGGGTATVMNIDGNNYTAASGYLDFEGGDYVRAFPTISSSYPTMGALGRVRVWAPAGSGYELKAEMIPVYVVATNEAGFWDTVSETFYGKSSGTNAFTYIE